MNVQITTITPEYAQQLLDSSKGNRSLRRPRLQKYTQDMLEGNWHCNGDAIRIYADGTLQDGHHRLQAVVNSGVSLQTVLVTGLTEVASLTVDKGSVRTNADEVAIRNKDVNPKLAACIVGMIDIVLRHDAGKERCPDWARNGGGVSLFITNSFNVMQEFNRNKDYYVGVAEWVNNLYKGHQIIIPKAYIGAMYVLGSRIDEVRTKEFLAAVVTGFNLKEGDVAAHTRELFLSCKAGSRKWGVQQKIATLAKVTMAYIKGKRYSTVGNAAFSYSRDNLPRFDR